MVITEQLALKEASSREVTGAVLEDALNSAKALHAEAQVLSQYYFNRAQQILKLYKTPLAQHEVKALAQLSDTALQEKIESCAQFITDHKTIEQSSKNSVKQLGSDEKSSRNQVEEQFKLLEEYVENHKLLAELFREQDARKARALDEILHSLGSSQGTLFYDMEQLRDEIKNLKKDFMIAS